MSTALRDRLGERILRPEDPGYDEVRAIHNGRVARRPALIGRCRTADGAVAALALARDEGLEVSVRGGGHNVAGRAVTDGGVMIDLAEMKAIAVDPERGTATAGGGVLWNELNDATGAHGLAVTGGAISSPGVARPTPRGGPRRAVGQDGAAARHPLGARAVAPRGGNLR